MTSIAPTRRERFRVEPSAGTAVWVLVGLAAFSTLFRALLVGQVHAPTVFNDELIYQRLAYSIGTTGHPTLFTHGGLSYSPLYPLVLSPIFALGASAPTAYTVIKLLNAGLISLSVFPIYGIARFVLSRRLALLAAAISIFFPALAYSSFVMTENLAYPLCLASVWAMLVAVDRPGWRTDLLALVSVVVTTAARLQLVVLVPVAVTAMLLAALFAREGLGVGRSLLRTIREHALLFGAVAGMLLVALGVEVAGRSVSSAGGSYAVVAQSGVPNIGHFLRVLLEHAAALEFAVALVPFVGTLVAGYLFFWRASSRVPYAGFAAVGLSLVGWLLLETAYHAAEFDGPGQELPRIHERFLVYVAPLFLVALLAAWQAVQRRDLPRVYLAAAGVTALLPLAIPFDRVINSTAGVDSFGLALFARIHHGALVPVNHATLFAVWFAATFALLYVHVRMRLRIVVVLTLLALLVLVDVVPGRIESSSASVRLLLPRHADWVDRAASGDVALLTGSGSTASALETAFMNLSINRSYALCTQTLGNDFGEQQPAIDAAGRLRDASGAWIAARYAVVPARLGVRGRVVARDPRGRVVLVKPAGGKLRVAPGTRAKVYCATRRRPH